MSYRREEKYVPSDEPAAEKPPDCPRCGAEMWLVVVSKTTSDDRTDSRFTYECRNCGAVAEIDKPDLTA